MTTQTSYFNPKMFAPVRELMSPEILLNPFPWFKRMRETSPVRYDDLRDTWDLFTYDLALAVMKDPVTFSSARMPAQLRIAQSIVFLDPPRHTQLRDLVSKAFTPKRVADFAPRIQEITNSLLDAVADKGQMDVVADLGVPLPVRVIAELIGIPEEDHMLFKAWSDVFMQSPESPTPEAMEALRMVKNQAEAEFVAYVEGLLEQRRQEPQPDMLTVLLEAEVDGQRLAGSEVVAFCMLLLIAGNETTTHLITHGVRCLIDHPEALAQLRARPEWINSAVEEVLRYASPVKCVERVATVDTEIAGHSIKAGQGVAMWLGSCNRDESKFVDSETFRIDRDPNPHMSFGFGIHFCLGAPLARLEAQVALSALVERFTKLEFEPGMQLEPLVSTMVYSFKRLPIRFEA